MEKTGQIRAGYRPGPQQPQFGPQTPTQQTNMPSTPAYEYPEGSDGYTERRYGNFEDRRGGGRVNFSGRGTQPSRRGSRSEYIEGPYSFRDRR